MVEVRFYNNSSDNDEVHKNISQIQTAQCEIFQECSIQAPVFLVTMSDALINCNYVYVPKFHRYYYVTDMQIYDGVKVKVSCKVDVLMSFWDSFKNSSVIAERSSSNYNKYLPDNMIPFSSKMRYEVRRLPFTFTPTESGNHYLLTLGGSI